MLILTHRFLRGPFWGLFFSFILTGCLEVQGAKSFDDVVKISEAGDLADLDAEALQESIKRSKVPFVIQLTAPWCDACQADRIPFWRLGELSKKDRPRLLTAQVDIVQFPELYQQLGYPGIPSYILFEKGQERLRVSGHAGLQVLRQTTEHLAKQSGALSYIVNMNYAPPQRGALRSKSQPFIFLVAGSSAAGSFGEEIAAQRQHFLRLGFKPEDIACFYAAPEYPAYLSDKEQFDSLRDELHACQVATMAAITQALQDSAKAQPEFLYLYITSHGIDRDGAIKLRNAYENLAGIAYPQTPKLCPAVENYQLNLDRTPVNWLKMNKFSYAPDIGGDGAMDFPRVCLAGKPQDSLLTPTTLAYALKTWKPETPKFIVLQGCHSGGFLTEKSPLLKLKKMTILTASRHDRVSFGCSPEEVMTSYGQVFLEHLRRQNLRPSAIAWKTLHQAVADDIARREKQDQAGQVEQKPSLPQFYSN